jgi:hypothetical protein
MNKYRQFVYKRYEFDVDTRHLRLYYGYDDVLEFCETYHFDFQFVDYSEKALERTIELLFFMAGVSYYKLYLAPEIVIRAGQIDQAMADFLSKTYSRGLGEFFYVNQLDPKRVVQFPINSSELPPLSITDNQGKLIGLGGGKDSLVSVELMRDQPKVATWSLNHRSQLEPLVARIELPHFWITREWDQQLVTLNQKGALNGHVPFSAILACVGNIVSILSGYRDVMVSNESSASEPNLKYKGIDINHQYSKSLEFEKDFQISNKRLFDEGLRYYSFLRPFSELRIAELFAKIGFDKYQGVFSSCNRAYRHSENVMFWCGECAKCAFVCLILTPFVVPSKLLSIWGGTNLLLESSLDNTYRQLLGIAGDKPLDCVGEVKEARVAMRLASERYPELKKYEFDLPADYNFRAWSPHAMPTEVFAVLKDKLS